MLLIKERMGISASLCENRFILSLLLTILCMFSFCIIPAALYAQEGYDIYFDNTQDWLIMAYSELNQTDSKYSIYLEVTDANSTVIPAQSIKGLTENPTLIAGDSISPVVGLAFDNSAGTAYIVYETESGLTPTVKVPDIVSIVLTYKISGAVKTAGSVAISGVTMTLSGTKNATTATDNNGNYSFMDLANGPYSVTPGKNGCTFNPTNRPVIISGADIAGQNFTGNCQAIAYIISGRVTTSRGAANAGVTMTLNGAKNATTITNSTGYYSFTGLSNGTYTVKPSKTRTTFSPPSKTIVINGANITQNFTSYP